VASYLCGEGINEHLSHDRVPPQQMWSLGAARRPAWRFQSDVITL